MVCSAVLWVLGTNALAKAQRNEHAEDGRHGQHGEHEAVVGHAGDGAGKQRSCDDGNERHHAVERIHAREQDLVVREIARECLDGCRCGGAGKSHHGCHNQQRRHADGHGKHDGGRGERQRQGRHEHDPRPRSVNEGTGSRVPHKHHDIHHEHERRDLCRARIQHVGGATDDAHKVGRLEPQLVEKTRRDKPSERRVHEQPP